MQAQTVLAEHKPQNVNGRNGAFTIHKFKGQDGVWYETSKQDLANTAYALFQSQDPALIDYTAEVNGQYTNNKINSVQPAGAAQLGAPTAAPVVAPIGPATPAANGGAAPPTQGFRNESSPNEAGRIARSVAVEHLPKYIGAGVFEVPDSLEQLGDQLATLARYIFNGSRPGAAAQGVVSSDAGGGEQTGAPQAPAEAAPVSSAPPAAAAPPTVPTADDDIPF